MRKVMLAMVMCLCLIIGGRGAGAAELVWPDDLLPIVVVLHDGSDTGEVQSLLLIVVQTSTGKALKATLRTELFPAAAADMGDADALQTLVQSMGERLEMPLEKYVSLGADALSSMEAGEAREKSLWALIELGTSLLGNARTNLPMGEAISTFQRAFAQQEGNVIALPEDLEAWGEEAPSEEDWAALREALYRAMETL